MNCPHCATSLDGLARYCWVCQEYVEEESAPMPTLADTRSEEDIRMATRRALELLDFVVIDFEQGYRRDGSTRVREGLADLYIMGFGVGVWREMKNATGRVAPEQRAFGDDCRRCGIDWGVWRHENEAIEWAKSVRESITATGVHCP